MIQPTHIANFNETIGSNKYLDLLQRLKEVNDSIRLKGIRSFHTLKGKGCFNGKSDLITGYAYDEFYDWDLYFENIYLSYYGVHKYCRSNLEAFLDIQLPCGFVSRTLVEPRHRQHFKPFLTQIALLGSRQWGNFEWLRIAYYQRLKKYISYWFWYCDYDKNGLCTWNSADHSGMDNQVARSGELDSIYGEGVDLNTYLYRELIAMSELAKALGHHEDAENYLQHASTLKDLINETFWHDEDGFYYDRNEQTGELITVKTVAGFLPLWAGIVPKDRAERLVTEHLLNEDEFWLDYPIPSMAQSEQGFTSDRVISADNCNWCGPTWIPTNYMIFHGLMDYGYKDVAKTLAYKTFEMVLTESDTREYYSSITGLGQGLNPFWGWSTLAYLMPLEYELGYDPTDLHRTSIEPLASKYFNLDF